MSGTLSLLIDGEEVASGALALVMRVISSVGSSVGEDAGSPVSPMYVSPNPFTGFIHAIDVDVAASKREAAQAGAELAAEMGRQ